MHNMEALKKLDALKKTQPEVRKLVSKCLQNKFIKNYKLPVTSAKHKKFITEEVDNMPDERLKYDIMLESSLMAAGDRAFQLQALLKEIKKSKKAEPSSSDLNDQIQWLNKVSTMQGTIEGCLERRRGQ